MLPLHPTAAYEHHFDPEAPMHDIKDYHPVPSGYRKVTPPHHPIHATEVESTDSASDSEDSQQAKTTLRRQLAHTDSDIEIEEIHRHGEDLSMALLLDRKI